jgi:phosphoribosylanthranilate isomerase
MPRTRIKICGVTRPQDAEAAAIAGADAIGMIFHPPAPRNISMDRARMIMHVLPQFVTPVGVFVDTEAQEILDTAAELGLRNVQLNGEQTADDIAELEGLLVIKSIRVAPDNIGKQLDQFRKTPPANLIGFVLEPANTGQPGGSGVANNWAAIADEIAAGTFKNLPPLIAAGGLKPENVGDVIRQIRPFAVDVSSGVEESLGIKSSEKIQQFVREVRRAESSE